MKLVRLASALLPLALSTGCATILHGTRQEVFVDTDPPGATATAGDQTITTPGTLKLERKEKNLEVLVQKKGYVSRRVKLTRKDSGLFWANMGFIPVGYAAGVSLASTTTNSWSVFENMWWGGVAGSVVLPAATMGVDLATGAAYKLDPPTIVLRLEPLGNAETGDH